jgi:hypothetical protein
MAVKRRKSEVVFRDKILANGTFASEGVCATRSVVDALTTASQEFAVRAEELRSDDKRYESMHDALERARQVAEQAHIAYFAHREEHGC